MKSFLLCGLSCLLLSSTGVTLVVPFLSDGAESSGLLESFQLQLADRSHPLGKVGKLVDVGRSGSLLLILNKSINTLGVSLRMPDLALVTGVFSCLGKRTSLLR